MYGRTFGRVRLGFIVSKTATNKPTIATNTPTGTMNVSTPEVTVLNLVSDPGHSGGPSNVATSIADLLEDDNLDIHQLINAAAHYPASVVQRTGWMIEHAATKISKDSNPAPILAITRNPNERTLLSPSGPRRGKTNPRWQVVVNTEIETDR